MLNDLNFRIESSKISKDSQIAKNIINKLFVFVDACFRNDKEINPVIKSIALNQLPGILKGSKEYVDKMNNTSIKKLLDDIQHEISMRK
jgi:flagellar motor switch protein FliG